MEIGITRCCNWKQVPFFMQNAYIQDWKNIHAFPYNGVCYKIKRSCPSLAYSHPRSTAKNSTSQICWRTYSTPVNLEESVSMQPEDYSDDEDNVSKNSPDDLLDQPLSSDDLKALAADSERSRLVKKLSEANQHNRFLKRQLYVKDHSLAVFKSELGVMELEIQALVSMAEEIAQSEIPVNSRKIHGKYIQSHLVSRLEAVHAKMKYQIKDVEAAQLKEVELFWCGMAESVQVMGSFDGWSQGEHLSPTYDGSFTNFKTILMLRPGRYEIKFLVDGEWLLSPEYPTVGEGLTKNNLLTVE